ncbi:cuticle collagen 7-like [Phodopus roborovskii]|uniref:cuticle collagen 7-like n=1 Tax=Phodopus roborovskii TaxID=109678 RepID=UPI0021E37A9C|nr:cuticle collagen 7-like [Phodopus roborovskii]
MGGGHKAPRGRSGSAGDAGLEAQPPAARANCAELLQRSGCGARVPVAAARGSEASTGRHRAAGSRGHGHVLPAGLARSDAPGPRGPPAGTRAPRAHTLPGTHAGRPAHPPRPALPRAPPRPRGAGRRPPIGWPAHDARRPAPPLVSHSAEAALAGTSLVRRLAAAAAAAAAAGARAQRRRAGGRAAREGGGRSATLRTALLL